MCGIVGYWGPKNPKKVIVDGLRRLEYRGYDSTGVAIFDNDQLNVVRSPGKLVNLEEKMGTTDYSGPTGIGHTRWATHGEPTEKNAHPHKVGGVAITHNGIIENYKSLREQISKSGLPIQSDTDSELIAHLINSHLEQGKDALKAVVDVIPQLEGAYSILVANEREPETLVAFKNGTPMVVGMAKDEVLIASDIQAIIEHTKDVVYLNDGEIVVSNKGDVQFFDATGKAIEKKVVHIDWTADAAEKQGFDYFMEKEIYEQPRALIQTMEPHIVHDPLQVKLKESGFTDKDFAGFKRIQLIACGTAWHAALIGRYYLERLAKLPADIDIASEFRYRQPILAPDTLAIFVSQSGETADTLACLRLCKDLGVKTLSLCNVQQSSIDREADGHLYTKAGPEIGVCSTKAFTTQTTMLHILALHLAQVRNSLASEEIEKQTRGILALPSQVEVCLNHDKWFKEAAHTLSKYKGYLYLGRGFNYPVALEGALKLKEITYKHAEGYPSGEMKHGPIALVDSEMAIIAIAPQDEIYQKNVSNIEEVKARGGHIIAIGTGEDEHLKDLSTYYLALPQGISTTNPVLAAIPIQLMSLHLAVEMGRDVDQPRNLAKSVTVE